MSAGAVQHILNGMGKGKSPGMWKPLLLFVLILLLVVILASFGVET